ncbi:hypothetical protein [Streptomyces griseocarneus]|uniref:hypothetical protein n=1 Tax=Streptomyces griseocarneus TaxID=51201 RepID=UPI0019C678C9|nr:hypothetical protein [Streptomyces griseocarneus]MBZ6475298.1 hypothetical protein [Streptomyces griseocarneus]GHG74463.1 hypothetical protein GCM10018779_51190 [Streptomyces griseocarneus]
MDSLKADSRPDIPRFEDAEPVKPQVAPFVRDFAADLNKHGNLKPFGQCLSQAHAPLTAHKVPIEAIATKACILRGDNYSRRTGLADDSHRIALVRALYTRRPPQR